jgi:uncharacterized protein (DUF952 family)
MSMIYKLCQAAEWEEAERSGTFAGSAVDMADGYIHFSTDEQVAGTAARHFAGASSLVIVAVETEELGTALRWEVSRGGARFPHLYGKLPVSAVRWVKPLRLDENGRHVFPTLRD